MSNAAFLPSGALFIGPAEKAALTALRALAAQHPVDMTTLRRRIRHAKGKREHMAQMTRQSVRLPTTYMVTFSIETGHPMGTARHMSLSSARNGKVPIPEAVWMVAEELGFVGSLDQCRIWLEDPRRPRQGRQHRSADVNHRRRQSMTTNADARTLARQTYDRLLSIYPLTDASTVDPRLEFSLAFAAGALSEGLDAEREDRKLRMDERSRFIARNLLAVVDVVLKDEALPGPHRALLSGAAERARALL